MKVVNILLAEDDHLDVTDIRRSLDKMNLLYNLRTATNGEEAIAYLSSDEEPMPDIALIDIDMPRMNGLELLTAIRNKDEWKHLKCFMITTADDELDKEAALKLGASGYIVKPLKWNNPSSIDAFNLMIDLINM